MVNSAYTTVCVRFGASAASAYCFIGQRANRGGHPAVYKRRETIKFFTRTRKHNASAAVTTVIRNTTAIYCSFLSSVSPALRLSVPSTRWPSSCEGVTVARARRPALPPPSPFASSRAAVTHTQANINNTEIVSHTRGSTQEREGNTKRQARTQKCEGYTPVLGVCGAACTRCVGGGTTCTGDASRIFC